MRAFYASTRNDFLLQKNSPLFDCGVYNLHIFFSTPPVGDWPKAIKLPKAQSVKKNLQKKSATG
jgi:hypothetical protein